MTSLDWPISLKLAGGQEILQPHQGGGLHPWQQQGGRGGGGHRGQGAPEEGREEEQHGSVEGEQAVVGGEALEPGGAGEEALEGLGQHQAVQVLGAGLGLDHPGYCSRWDL